MNTTQRTIARYLFAVLAAWLLQGDTLSARSPKAIEIDQLSTLVQFVDEDAVVAKIEEVGIAFPADEAALEKLRKAGASPRVVEAVAKAARPGPAPDDGTAVSWKQLLTLLETLGEEKTTEVLAGSPTLFTLDAEQERTLREEYHVSDAFLAAVKGDRIREPARKVEVTDVALVFDCSGSMMEQTPDGEAKMEVARRVVDDLVASIPNGLGLTFVVYGHDKRSECRAVEVLRSADTMDDATKGELRSMIARLQPVGQTPIALALRTAGAELAKKTGQCGLVLISDGKETCHGDPAAEAAALVRNLDLAFGAHVIGFDVDAEGRAQLEAVAAAGRGRYYDAKNAAELTEAVADLKRAIQRAVGPDDRSSIALEFAGQKGEPGTFFHDAGLLEPDAEYSGSLAMMEAHYYRIPLRKGAQIRAIAQVQKSPYTAYNESHKPARNRQTFTVTVFDEDLGVVAREAVTVQGTPTEMATVRATWTAEKDTVAYVAVSASDNHDGDGVSNGVYRPRPPKPSPYKLRLRLRDAEGTPSVHPVPCVEAERGTNFRTAGRLAAPGLAVTDLKLDEVGFFQTEVREGDVLRVSVAGQKPWYGVGNWYSRDDNRATYTVSIYDDDQVRVAEKQFDLVGNTPDAGAAALEWKVEMIGTAWITVSVQNSENGIYVPRERDPSAVESAFVGADGHPKPAWVAVQVVTADAEAVAAEKAPSASDQASNK